MSFFSWSDKYSVDIPEMDKKKKKLFEILQEHFDAISQNKGNEALIKIFEHLHNYTIEHFSAEEKYMIEYNYPEYDIQKKEHKFFIDKIKSFKEDWINNKKTLSIDVSIFLKEWLLKHILVEDKKYSTYFKNKGII